MNPTALFNQSASLYTKSGYDGEGRETVGSATDLICRAQETTKRRLMPNGSLVEIALILYVPATTVVNTDDKITYNSNDYKVFSKYSAVDGTGAVNHLKLECTKWQAT